MVQLEAWRALSPIEAEILDTLRLAEFLGRDELRVQLASASVALNCACGCGSLDFQIGLHVPPVVDDGVVIESEGFDEAGMLVGVALVVRAGRLSQLEVYSPTGAPIGLPIPVSLRRLEYTSTNATAGHLSPRTTTIREESDTEGSS